jgi:FKBP-type peptidyl-prolyl cis-trans isomerase 2
MSIIMKGQTVGVHYVGTLDDGTEFDNSRGRETPMFFKVGERQVLKGFENAVIGMKLGETKKVSITPDQGYGVADPNLFKKLPKSNFPDDFVFDVGLMVEMKSPNGNPFVATIMGSDGENVTLDFNHPLSGKTLNFEIELVQTDESGETTTKGET